MVPYSTLFAGKIGRLFCSATWPQIDTPVLEPATRTKPPSIKYNAARNRRPSEVVLNAGKKNRKLYAMLKKKMMTQTEHLRRETQCGEVVMKTDVEGRMGWRRSEKSVSIAFVNGGDRI